MLFGIVLSAVGVSSVGVIVWLLFFTDDGLRAKDQAPSRLAGGDSIKSLLATPPAPATKENEQSRQGRRAA